jgi:redox-sensitive bicupin YhaK (pirin superfamily)
MSALEIIEPREVPLGGLRAMTVRRTLPSRERSLIGAWCFLDHYGPDDLAVSEPMIVPPHPHTGLSTVSWLFTGEVDHRDSAGNQARVRPGELNLMTAGRGISHSEYVTEETRILHGCQLWLALPDHVREMDPGFERYVPDAVEGPGWTARVFLGSFAGSVSPVKTHTPLLGAELSLKAGIGATFSIDAAHEHGVLVDTGTVQVNGESLAAHALGYLPIGSEDLTIEADSDARLILLGGPPFGEEIVMWWNFVGRTHEDIVEYRNAWEARVDTGDASRFDLPVGDPRGPLHAPVMPNVRLRSRH